MARPKKLKPEEEAAKLDEVAKRVAADFLARVKYLENARKWMKSEGKAALTTEVLEALLVNLQIEREEGQNIREYDPTGPSHARACRKQFRETTDAVLEILDIKEKQ